MNDRERPDRHVAHPRKEVLHDGTTVDVRPIEPADATRLVRFHDALSFEAIRRRFFGAHPHLNAREVERFTTVDHHDREALVALVGDEIVGVGRYERLGRTFDAEVAFVVADRWQGRGAAPILLRLLADRAREERLRRFVAETLEENHPMMKVFRRSGLALEASSAQGVVHVSMLL